MNKGIKIGLISGDGHGNVLVNACKRVLTAILPDNPTFIELQAGYEVFKKSGNALPEKTVEALANVDAAIFGTVQSPMTGKEPNYVSPIVSLRQKMGLFAHLQTNVDRSKNIDFAIVREATECLFVAREHMRTPDVAVAERIISRKASLDIAHFAFKQALLSHERRIGAAWLDSMKRRELGNIDSSNSNKTTDVKKPSVTFAHKANILPVTDGLMRTVVFDQVAPMYPNIEVKEVLIDMMVYKLFRDPSEFDVILACNTYGDILDDAAAAVTGGLGVTPIGCSNNKFILAHGADVVVQPSISLDYATKYSNPIGHIRSLGMILDRLNLPTVALTLEQGIISTIEKGIITPDMGGNKTTNEVVDSIIDQCLFHLYKYFTMGTRS